jgi:hypothetical protein
MYEPRNGWKFEAEHSLLSDPCPDPKPDNNLTVADAPIYASLGWRS